MGLRILNLTHILLHAGWGYSVHDHFSIASKWRVLDLSSIVVNTLINVVCGVASPADLTRTHHCVDAVSTTLPIVDAGQVWMKEAKVTKVTVVV